MNLGGTPSINLSEAMRLLKQSNVGINSVQNQQVTPPMMFMQQAVAMQQFQFQQALLMQQVMATQQATARAATVKSAQEMAAARAAEISKLLKGIESDVEEKKKSPRRFMSRTPSRSRSRSHSCSGSFSRSKSRSPFHYRRDRSTSRSPIRYRRDSRPSPISREYFRYPRQSRRGYYRGRGEYGWNPSYQHDWERKRDHYSLYLHHSKSRSRSPIFRRSCTPSRSPRYKRERSSTPLRFRHKDHRLECSSRHLRSLEAKPIPSCSQSWSYSHSHSQSLYHEHGSQSPIQIWRDGKSGRNRKQAKKLNLALDDNKCDMMKNPNTNGIKDKFHPNTIVDENEEIVEHWNSRSKSKTKQSISPTRSLSVSLSPPKKKEKRKLEKELKSNDWKKAMVRSIIFQRIDEIVAIDELSQNNMAPFVNIEDGEGNINVLVEQQTDIESDVKSKERESEVLNKQCPIKEYDRTKSPFDESDEDEKVFDDWQDCIKANELEKIQDKENKQEMDQEEDEEKNLNILLMHEDDKDRVMTLLEHLDMGTRELRVDSSNTFEDQRNAITSSILERNTPNNDVLLAKPTSSNKTLINGLGIKEEILNIVSNENREGDVKINKEIATSGDDVNLDIKSNEKNVKSSDVIGREGDLDLIFEGPMLPPNLDITIREDLNGKKYATKSCCENVLGKTRPEELSSVEEVVIYKKKGKSRSKEVEDGHELQKSKDKLMLKDGSQLHENCKSKGKTELRERSRNKRYTEKIEYDKRKEKHRKPKIRHWKNEEIEKEENDNDENKDIGFSKSKEKRHRHCNKKHGRSQIHTKYKHEKRRHKHKHRETLTMECLDEESLIVEVEGKDMN